MHPLLAPGAVFFFKEGVEPWKERTCAGKARYAEKAEVPQSLDDAKWFSLVEIIILRNIWQKSRNSGRGLLFGKKKTKHTLQTG